MYKHVHVLVCAGCVVIVWPSFRCRRCTAVSIDSVSPLSTNSIHMYSTLLYCIVLYCIDGYILVHTLRVCVWVWVCSNRDWQELQFECPLAGGHSNCSSCQSRLLHTHTHTHTRNVCTSMYPSIQYNTIQYNRVEYICMEFVDNGLTESIDTAVHRRQRNDGQTMTTQPAHTSTCTCLYILYSMYEYVIDSFHSSI